MSGPVQYVRSQGGQGRIAGLRWDAHVTRQDDVVEPTGRPGADPDRGLVAPMRVTAWNLVALRGAALLLVTLLGACSQAPMPPSTEPLDAWRNHPVQDLPFDDTRLGSVFAELRRHPEWLDAPLAADPTVLALVPGTSDVCLALEGPSGDVHVTIDPSGPWSVAAVGIDRGEIGREVTFAAREELEGDADACTFAVFGRRDPWPAAPDAIEVTGNADASLGRAIAEAVHTRPERFGIDRRGIPSVLVGEPIAPAPEGWTCLQAVVFVGGPRSHVVIGARRAGDGSVQVVESRIVERALIPPEPRREGQC